MQEASEQDTHTRRIAIAITLAALLAGGAWWYFTRMPVAPAAVAAENGNPVAAGQIIPAAPPPPAIENPLDLPAETETAGTAKVDPDAAALSALNGLFGPALDDWLIPDRLLRRLVATADNLGRNGRTESLRPLRAPREPFAVKREPLDPTVGTERITLAPANYRRYDAAVALLSRVDTAQAVAVYKQLYPRLQRAWEDLGFPDVYFNDRVVEVIDHLLATPEPAGTLLLDQPKVLYLFADQDLESRTAGQKLLLRIGVEHARLVKQKLREFRAQIAKE
jgi:hypothetical protein